MNRLQFTYIASFLITFTSLFLALRFIDAKLQGGGYNFSELILYGLPRNATLDSNSTNTTEKAVVKFRGNPFAQVLAFTFAVVTSLFFYFKFAAKRKPVLNPQIWQEFPLTKKIVVSPNTAIYRFSLPHPQDVLGLPIGQHISVSAEINGKDIMRSYTPTSSDDDLGHFDLLIKSYEKGNISRHIGNLKIGDKIRVKGPKGQFQYSPSLSSELGMIAGGTGITPMLQIIRAALKNPLDLTKVSLIYANVNPEDILLRKELDDLAKRHSKRFKIYYVLNNPPAMWNGGVGFVTKEQIKQHLPATDANIKILMCGPPPMMTAMKKHLDELKYPAPRTVSKLVDQVFLF